MNARVLRRCVLGRRRCAAGPARREHGGGHRLGEALAKAGRKQIEAARGHVARTVNSAINFGAGYSIRNLRRIRQFFLTYPRGSVVSTELGGPEKRPTVMAESKPLRSGKKRPTVLAELRPASAQMFPASLSWAHYAFLLKVENPDARAFYEIEALREAWSARELETRR